MKQITGSVRPTNTIGLLDSTLPSRGSTHTLCPLSRLVQEQLNRGLMMSIARILLLLNLCVALRDENTAGAGAPTCRAETQGRSCLIRPKTRDQEAVWGTCQCQPGTLNKCRSVTVDISSCCPRWLRENEPVSPG